MEFVETTVFTRQIATLLADEEYRLLQTHLTKNPAAGALIEGTGGLRKVRVSFGQKGKRGGARVIYYWAFRKDLILFLFVYPKSAAADLTPHQKAELRKLLAKEKYDDEEAPNVRPRGIQ